MAESQMKLTKKGYEELKKRLHYLKAVQRPEVAQRIRQAKEFGEIGENSEYEDAKLEQAFVEGEILNLEKMIQNAIIIDESELPEGVVSIGSTVKIREKGKEKEEIYKIVSTAECDPRNGKISNESPMGSKLVDCRIGDSVKIEAPAGTSEYEILDILN
ncbi:MAG TPA: transcription elongation factor GreA [Candidatus Eremiobacteraeota bacterium]|mgnify:CR=1 FL=1|nr:MAG: Transcription elongation factor GreA [bacterium ADurb.Bin363]HPZ06634.1 transcription elongation factor GreA [Candidatus Eremiobacteraeota bacterium]